MDHKLNFANIWLDYTTVQLLYCTMLAVVLYQEASASIKSVNGVLYMDPQGK